MSPYIRLMKFHNKLSEKGADYVIQFSQLWYRFNFLLDFGNFNQTQGLIIGK